ncbi:MAG TPA: hypothetical protein VH280_17790 [Verrucomicrobiae bacterium]|jgi:hypothetical protein|nr:hypothetical protein [Verrucomicrobiae bacterium]
MKNKIRVGNKGANKPTSAQSEKPSIRGQNAATFGHIKSKVKGKITLGALRAGEAIGLAESEIRVLASKAALDGLTPDEYCKLAVLERLFHPDHPSRNASSNTAGRDTLCVEGRVRTPFEKALILAEIIGRELSLNEKEIKALALLSECRTETVCQYCAQSIRYAMQESYSNLYLQARDSQVPEERESAANALRPLDELALDLFPPPGQWREPYPVDLRRFEARTELENAVTETKALLQLMFNVIEHDGANDFAANNGHLAAGLMGLMKSIQTRLGNAWQAV